MYREAGVSRSNRVFRKWKREANFLGAGQVKRLKRGRPPTLQDWQTQVLLGGILFLNKNNRFVDRQMVWEFATKTMRIKVHPKTISTMLRVHGFGNRVAQVSEKDEMLPAKDLASMYHSWITAQRTNGNLDKPLSQIGSIDCTYTQHRTYKPRTLVRRGG